ncbi:GLPGLI family protein [Flavobacterium agricola]|uniref:GLPGLI family protein n=1 Tax=Flavobacterium agricola TaxID=2870839 RepID=A0ABY6LXU2_9FLAO|nr:GLPGLI family protein [Flavobacterium agricola]UYW00797.1 GLPGLI family protein [Flavobacterium agricola]
MFEQEGDLHNAFSTTDPYIATSYQSKSEQQHYKINSPALNLPALYHHRNFADYDWQITTESKIIDGFTCYKARGVIKNFNEQYNQHIEAWFCPAIALPYGPYIYAGLPGLIFEVYRLDGKELHWKLKAIEKNKTKSFAVPDAKKTIHYEVYDKLYDDAIQKIMRQ